MKRYTFAIAATVLAAIIVIGWRLSAQVTQSQAATYAATYGGLSDRDIQSAMLYVLAGVAGVPTTASNMAVGAATYGGLSDHDIQAAQLYLISQQGPVNFTSVSPTGSDSSGIAGNGTKPFATISAALTAAGPSNSVVVMPGTYTPTPNTFALMQNGQKLIGLGQPTIRWSANFQNTSGPVTTNGSVYLVLTNNCVVSGLDFVATNTATPSGFIGGNFANDSSGRGPGFTNVLVENCRFYGITDVFYDQSTNLFQSRWINCFFQSGWDVFALNGGFPSSTNDWQFDNCKYILLDTNLANIGAAFKNIFNIGTTVANGQAVWTGCRFTDLNSLTNDSVGGVSTGQSWQTWIFPPGAMGANATFRFVGCAIDNGNFQLGSQNVATNTIMVGCVNGATNADTFLQAGFFFNTNGLASTALNGLTVYGLASATNGVQTLARNKLSLLSSNVAATTYKFTNTLSQNIVVYLGNGTNIGIGVNETPVGTMTNAIFTCILQPNEWLSDTNSGQFPTLKFKPF